MSFVAQATVIVVQVYKSNTPIFLTINDARK
jgi:hypothetical protein